jgi:drug/metabolite transporter (DMT)-like permease
MNLKSSKYSYLELIISCTIFGASGIFLKHIYEMQIASIIFYRLIFGFIILVAYCILTKKLDLIYLGKKKRFLLLIGVFNVLTLYTYFTSIKYAGISIAVLLLYTAPVYVTLFSPFFLKDRVTKRGLLSLIISITGILIVIMPGGSNLGYGSGLMIGLMFGVLSGLSYSGTIMTVSYLRDEYSGTTQLFWSTFISLLILLPFASQVPSDILLLNLPALILFGLITTAFASVLYLNSAARIRAQTVSVLALLEPVSGIIFGFFFLQEPIFLNTIQGCFFILLGALVLIAEPKGIDLAAVSSKLYRSSLSKDKLFRVPFVPVSSYLKKQ